MSRVLVLGANGFLGRHVVAACAGHPAIHGVVPFGRADLDLLEASVDEAREAVEASGCDVVVNCTGRLDGTPMELAAANLVPTTTLLHALAQMQGRTRLIRLGSAGEYGPVGRDRPVREDDMTWPVTMYGATHLAATHLLRAAVEEGLIRGTTLRIFNPVGPGALGTLAGQVARRILEAFNVGATAISTGPLTACRDFVDARDVGRAVAAAAAARAELPAIINIGSGAATPIRQVVQMLKDTAQFHGYVLEDQPAPGRSASVAWIAADVSLAAQHLGWTPTYTLEMSLQDLWDGLVASSPAPSPDGARLLIPVDKDAS